MNQRKPTSFSVKKNFISFKYAFNGIKFILSTQINFLIHLILAILVVFSGLVFKISNMEWIVIVLTIAIVLTAEAINTAIEKLTDMVSPDYDEQAGKVKDIAAASVFIVAIASVIIGLIIFLPKVY